MRFVSLFFSAIWIGGLAALGAVAAPAIFAVLQLHDPIAGRALAGEVFGGILARFQHVLWIIGVLQIALLGLRAALGPVPRRYKWQMAIMAVMLAATSYVTLAISPRIHEIRATSTTAISALADADPIKREFGRLHGMSNGLLALAFAGALTMFWFDARE